MSVLNEIELASAIREVLKRSVTDPAFRKLAQQDGAAAILAASGKTVPSGTTFTFVSNAEKATKQVMLPDPVADADSLSEEELEQVAGGMQACGVSTCGTSS